MIMRAEQLSELLNLRRQHDLTGPNAVGTTNGCFEILHPGHIEHLRFCRARCDLLVVMLNVDDYIRKAKHRDPVLNLYDRMKMVHSLSCVDWVTWFAEDDPRHILRLLRPNVHFNSEEYGEHCIEAETVADLHAKLVLVPRVLPYSTTQIRAALAQQVVTK